MSWSAWGGPVSDLGCLFVLLGAVLFLAKFQRRMVYLGMCAAHRRRLLTGTIGLWAAFAGGMLFLITCFLFAVVGEQTMGSTLKGFLATASCLGLAMFVGGLLLANNRTQPIWAAKIEGEFVWLRGVCADYLAALPDFSSVPAAYREEVNARAPSSAVEGILQPAFRGACLGLLLPFVVVTLAAFTCGLPIPMAGWRWGPAAAEVGVVLLFFGYGLPLISCTLIGALAGVLKTRYRKK